MPTPRNSLAGVAVNGKIYAIGGKDSLAGQVFGMVEAFDPDTNSWSTGAPMPTPRRKFTASVVGGRIYTVSGIPQGELESTAVEEYDPATDTWLSRSPIPIPRRLAAEGVVGGKIYVIGGQQGNQPGTLLDSVEVYDPATDTWSPRAPMPLARSSAAFATLNGRIYVIGGKPERDRVDEYDPATDTWTQKAALPTERIVPTASTLGGQIYVFGGVVQGTSLDVVEVYDPALGTWAAKSPMPTARQSFMSAVVDRRIYTIGGQIVPGSFESDDTEEYDPLVDGTSCSSGLPNQVGVVTVLGSPCPGGPGTLPGTVCLMLRVSCAGLAPIDVQIRVTPPDPFVPLRGTVVVGTGGGGTVFYADQSGGELLLQDLSAAGFWTVDRAWLSSWFVSGTSMKAQSCRYATLLTWIHDNVHTLGAFCATGNSGGSAEVGYALTTWDGGDLLDVAVLSGGPPLARLDLACPDLPSPEWSAACAVIVPAGVMECSPHSCTIGSSNPVCRGCSANPSLDDLRVDSVLHPAAQLDFPNTNVDVVVGAQDCSAAAFGMLFFNALSSQKTVQFPPGTPHWVPFTADGRAAILSAILAGS